MPNMNTKIFAAALVASVLSVPSVVSAANSWSLVSRLAEWAVPANALPGETSKSALNNFVSSSAGIASNSSWTWEFVDPKDITSVQIYTKGISLAVTSITVRYEGSEDYVTLDDSARAQSSTGAASGDNPQFALFSSDTGFLAKKVTGLTVNLGTLNVTWTNFEEIFVTGVNSYSDFNWNCGFYPDGGYEARAEDDLKDGFAMTGSDAWSNPKSNWVDDDPTTLCYAGPSTEFLFNFDSPKDLRRVRLASGTAGGFSLGGIYVKYDGADDYTRVTGSSLGYFVNGSRYQAIFEGDGCFARNVVSVYVKVTACDSNWRFAVGEVEIDGGEGFASAFNVDNVQAGPVLRSAITATAEAYPATIKILYGATDGVKSPEDWDHVEIVGTVASADDVLNVERTIDFKYCRYMLVTETGGVFSDPFELIDEPSVSVGVAETLRYQASFSGAIAFCGGTNEYMDVYLAYAKKGGTLGEYALVQSGVRAGDAVAFTLSGLDEVSDYDYSVKFLNGNGTEKTLSGSFSTTGECVWTLDSYDSSAAWVEPSGRLPFKGEFGVCDRSPSNGKYSLSTNSTIATTWYEPQDIERIEIYTYGSGSWNTEILKVEVRYSGDEDYTELSGTHFNPGSVASGLKKLVLTGLPGAKVAANVTALRFTAGFWSCNWAAGIGEIVVIGKATGSGAYHWEYDKYAQADFALPADALNDSEYVTLGGFAACEHDGSVSTGYASRYGNESWTWTFSKPHDIRTVELWSWNSGARSPFSVRSVYYKQRGDADWVQLTGGALDLFNYNSNGHVARLMADTDGNYVIRNIVALKVCAGDPNNAYSEMAEVYLTGKRYTPGLTLFVR